MKKIFLVILLLLLLVGCEYLTIIEYNPTEISDEPIATDANGTNDKIEFNINIETGEVLIDGRVEWSVVLVTDEFLSEFETYAEPLDNERGEARIAILPNTTMREFQWIEVGTTMSEDVFGVQFYQQNVLDAVGDLPSGVPFVARHWELGTFAHRGISFVDESGERRYFTISFNQAPDERPGSFIIREF